MIDPIAEPPDFEMVKASHEELIRWYGRDYSKWFTQIAIWYFRPLRKRLLATCVGRRPNTVFAEVSKGLIAYAKAVHETYNAVLQHDQKLTPIEV